MENNKQYGKYIYKKYKDASIPYGTVGEVVYRITNPKSTKLIMDFGQYGKAVVPLSAIELILTEEKADLKANPGL
ncbi:MAG: hypothetical protein AB7V50_07585 [Vampirovibrionia bacterium]